jgi:DNA-binding response OmpR family regulator
VTKGRVLIISDDEWMTAVLGKFLAAAGYDVHAATGAHSGFLKVRELAPDCIICDHALPDIDGYWVVRRVRGERTQVAKTPFVLVTDAEDTTARLQSLNLGADVYLTKPLRSEEVVGQVSALLDMAMRLGKRDSISDAPTASGQAALRGDLAQMALSTVMTVLELERRSGQLRVESKEHSVATFELSDGAMVGAQIGGKPRDGVDAMREVFKWTQGRFAFSNAAASSSPGPRQSIGALLIEVARLEDEQHR